MNKVLVNRVYIAVGIFVVSLVNELHVTFGCSVIQMLV